MRKREKDVFIELIRNCRESDRNIAKKLKISQPTVTRIRKKLEKTVIKTYTTVPLLSEVGVGLISFSFGKCTKSKTEMEKCLQKISDNNPEIIFKSLGRGMEKDCLLVAFHRNYKDYIDFLTRIKTQCNNSDSNFDSFLAPTTKDHTLDFSKPLLKLFKKYM